MNKIMALTAPTTMRTNLMLLDSDSRVVGVDNIAPRCISCKRKEFIGDLTQSSVVIHGYLGKRTKEIHIGTLLWIWLDNEGQRHDFRIKNSIFDPSGHSVLSPQY